MGAFIRLKGNPGRDPEFGTVKGGTPYIRFSVRQAHKRIIINTKTKAVSGSIASGLTERLNLHQEF